MNLEGVSIGNLGSCLAGNLVSLNQSANSLSLARNGLTDFGAKLVLDALVKNDSKIESLSLAHNRVQIMDIYHAAPLLEGVKKMYTLTALDLSSNNMRDEGLWEIASFLASDPHLKILELRSNAFAKRSVLANIIDNI